LRARDLGVGGQRVAVIAGIHGTEQEGLRHVPELVAMLALQPADIRLYEDVNPDGTAAHRRGTSAGVDPNRNWPASSFTAAQSRGPRPLSEPGVGHVYRDLVQFNPDLVVVLHSTSSGPFVNYDGPAEGLARRFAAAAGAPWFVKPSMGYATPGSLGSWMGRDRGQPILTLEFLRGSPPEQTGPALLAGLGAVIRDGPLEEEPPRVR
jgi:murein peptide amidase A